MEERERNMLEDDTISPWEEGARLVSVDLRDFVTLLGRRVVPVEDFIRLYIPEGGVVDEYNMYAFGVEA